MKDVSEHNEHPELEIVSPRESRFETFDDLKTADNSKSLETFDDLKTTDGSNTIETFDDLKETNNFEQKDLNEGAERQTNLDKTEASLASERPTDLNEQMRIDESARSIKNADWLKPEKWKTLSTDEKRIALDREVGDTLGKAYDQPTPPLSTDKSEPNALGEYGDGYTYDAFSQKIEGSNYGIRMNEDGVREREQKLFGDDPKAALETYSHEFRHSYQAEQTHAFEKGFKTDNPALAKEWSENFKDYKSPPSSELAGTDPEKYFQDYEAYRSQPVERDAREFASTLTDKVYGPYAEFEKEKNG